jgi:integrase
MLSLYCRHLRICEKKLRAKGMTTGELRTHRRCGCPVWLIGLDPHGAYHRHSLNTTSWQVAEHLKRAIELGTPEVPRVEIASALDAWKNALLAAKRQPRTVRQVHGAMTASLAAWCAHAGLQYLSELNLGLLDKWVSTWDYASTTHRSRIDLARSFFKFCLTRKWIGDNPASGLLKPSDNREPTLPFTIEEEARIFATAEQFGNRRHFGGLWSAHPETARALLLVLRWTGLRASDAVLFEPRKIRTLTLGGHGVAVYETYQTKTGEWVMCPLPPDVAEVIRQAPRLSEAGAFIPPVASRYQTDARSIANGFYSSYLCPLSTLSGVFNIHAHRFRDTFAVRLLEAGRSLETVQMLLGHSSIKTTEQHYAPWVRSRADMLIREVMGMWHR